MDHRNAVDTSAEAEMRAEAEAAAAAAKRLSDSDKRVRRAAAEEERAQQAEEVIVCRDEIRVASTTQGSLKEHLLLHSERAATYADFRSEVDTIASPTMADPSVVAPHE